jgi:hypothetical protein
MVASCQIDTFGRGHLEKEEGKDDFGGEGSTVNKITIEEVRI